MRKDIAIINPKSNIALATLWTQKDLVLKRLREKAKKVNVIGTLYSIYGINYVIHTLAHTPKINTLIIFGADLSKSGEALVKLFKEKKVVTGLRLLWEFSKIKEIIDSVEVIDLRDSFKRGDWEKLVQVIDEKFSPDSSKRRIIPLELIEPVGVSSWNHQLSGHYLYEYSLFRAWIKILETIMTYGFVKRTEYGEKQKQFLNLVTTIGVFSRDYALEKEFYTIFSEKDFEYHVKTLLTSSKDPGVAYTYGERIFSHPLGADQFRIFIEKLAERNDTRRALIVTWHHSVDSRSDNPPCLILIQGDLSRDYYNHTAYFRSHDVFSAWPLNVYGQILLALQIARNLSNKLGREIKVGYVTIISSSAHIYEHDWKSAEDILRKYGKKAFRAFVSDPRGNFIIKVEEQEIVVEHRDWEGAIVQVFRDKNPYELIKKMKLQSLLSMPDHAAYLAKEIMRAYFSLKNGLEYEQDRV